MEQDKLIAIAGLAERFQKLMGDDRYLAGLWESSFVESLVWVVLPTESEMHGRWPRRSKTWRAPSWSWACLDADVQFPMKEDEEVIHLIQILETHVRQASKSPTGPVSDAYIRLSGHLASFTFKTREHFNLTCRYLRRSVGHRESRTMVTDVDLPRNSEQLIFLLPVKMGSRDGKPYAEGLLLQQARSTRGTYSRIGSFWDSGDDCIADCFEDDSSNPEMYIDGTTNKIMLV
ncbi:MAG: hypothetical protein MMC23_009897 [Stictis urceolatum]|nr:hypothetical protein [Stictis urceolata]